MKFEKLKRTLRSDGMELRDMQSKVKTPQQFQKLCFENMIMVDLNNINDEYDQCVKELYEYRMNLEPTKTPIQMIKDKLDASKIFKDFEIIEDGSENPLIRYTNPVTKVKTILGTIDDLDVNEYYTSLSKAGVATLDDWSKALLPYMEPLKLHNMTHRIAVDTIVDNLFGRVEHIVRKFYDVNAPIVALEGMGQESDTIIPFTKKHSTLDDLHPILKSFLERTTDHKYLCAIIASRLLNFRHSYTPYLYGAGGDGKSTFVSFLSMLVHGRMGALKPEVSTFSLFNCVGKVFLSISDSGTKHVFNYEIVKKISGYDKISIESKYKNPKDLYLPGMIIITSNRMPEIKEDAWFQRRARIFTVAHLKSKDSEIIDPIKAAQAMNSTANEFLNYCLQCLEELGSIERGTVPKHPSLELMFKSSMSSDIVSYKDFIRKLGLDVKKDLIIEGFKFRNMVQKKIHEERKDGYFEENFYDYLVNNRHVTIDNENDTYHGIGIKADLKVVSNNGTTFDMSKKVS